MTRSFDDDELMAFCDGALDEPGFSQVASAIEADPALAQRLEMLVAGGNAARAVYGPLVDRPVPAKLRRGVEQAIADASASKIVSFSPPQRRWVWQSVALAASVAAVLAGPAGYFLARTAEGPLIAVGQQLASPLAAQLETLPSGDEARIGVATLRPIASFTDAARNLCREFEVDRDFTTVAVACRNEGGWRVAIAIDAPAADDGYAPASSLAALDAFLDSIGASSPLSPEAEQQVLVRQ